VPEFLGPVKGFGVTFRQMFRKVDTVQYPEEKKATAPRFHGRHQLNRWPDGLEKCIGCELCAWACPADAIYVEGADNAPDERYSPGERYGVVYQINYLRCILCGLCVEACPTRALTMTNDYEIADDNRESLIWTKEQLLAPLEPGMETPPHPMRLGESERDYYLLGSAGVASREAGNAEDTPAGTLSEPSSSEMAAAGEEEQPVGSDADTSEGWAGHPGHTPRPGGDWTPEPASGVLDARPGEGTPEEPEPGDDRPYGSGEKP